MKKIYWFEPLFFLFFGVFHLHRIWGLIDRESYAVFWMQTLERKGIIYYVLMMVLTGLCVLGIIVFFKEVRQNYWWRWIYLCGGGYLLFDLFAIAADLGFWHELLLKMFDTSAWFWNIVWGGFILLGFMAFILGLSLHTKRKKQKQYSLKNSEGMFVTKI